MQDEYPFIVKCPECGNEHRTVSVEFLNVEENIFGQDVMHFVCPETLRETSSLVFKI